MPSPAVRNWKPAAHSFHPPSLVSLPFWRPIPWTTSPHLSLKVTPPFKGRVHASRQLSLIHMSYYPTQGLCTWCPLNPVPPVQGWGAPCGKQNLSPTWHYMKAHCCTAHWKDCHFRVNTTDGPPTESFPLVAYLITHSRDKASAPLKLIFGSIVSHIWTPSVMWTFPGHMLNKCLFIPDRALRTEAKKWFYPSEAGGATECNWTYWAQATYR